MRTVTPQMSALLSQRYGTEPMLLVEVEWVDGTPVLYSDQELEGAIPTVVDLSGFDTSMMLSGSGDSQSVSVTLDDSDGFIRNLCLTHDIHKRPASVYLLFKGLPVAHKMLVFKGEIVTPVEWQEAARTLSFNIMSKLDAVEVGFSMEEGEFPNIPEEALGKAWPLVFGQVCHMPAVQVRAPRRGYLLSGTGIEDFTLEPRICQALQIQCPAQQTGPVDEYQQEANNIWSKTSLGTIGPDNDCVFRRHGEICKLIDLQHQQQQYVHGTLNIYNGSSFPQGTSVNISINGGIFTGSFSGNLFTVTNRIHPDFATFDHIPCRPVPDLGYGYAQEQARLLADKLRSIAVAFPEPRLYAINVNKPGGYLVEIDQAAIDKMKLDAIRMYGPQDDAALNDLAVQYALNKIDQMFPQPGLYGSNVNKAGGVVMEIDQADIDAMKERVTSFWYPDKTGTYFINNSFEDRDKAYEDCQRYLVAGRGPVGGPRDSWAYYDEMQEAGFFWAPAGSEVYLESEDEIVYIVSLISGTVDGVAAYKTAPNGKRYLTEVPTDLYTMYLENYQGYYVVEIHMSKTLSQVDENWDDQLYVSFTSTVGPNPCDIIQWLVEKYTDLTVDATTFAAVKTLLTKYPCNFYLFDRPDVYELIKDIAYQSRCRIHIRNKVVYITYLSLEPTSVRTLTTSDILNESFIESLSGTEDVYTTHKLTWQPAGAPVQEDDKIERKINLKYNVSKYGTVTDEYTYYCYNIFDLVLKSGTFWLIRKANSWRKVRFKLPIKHIDLDVGDCVTLNVPQFGSPVKVVIEMIQFESADNTLSVTCWTPIRSGETAAYYWAWPSQQSEYAVWPLPGDTAGGGGYTFDVTPPVGHILNGGAHQDDQLILTTGDLHPSDIDDTLPTVTCPVSDYFEFEETDPAIEAKEIAQAAARTAYAVSVSTGGGGAGGGANSQQQDKPEPEEECGKGAGCNYKVRVQWHTSHAQGQNNANLPGGCGGPCSCMGGCPSCYGPIWNVCHTFGSPGIAKQFAAYMIGQYGTNNDGATGLDGHWNCLETRVIKVTVSDGEFSPSAGCESVETSDSKIGGGEKYAPTGLTGNEATATGNQAKPALYNDNFKLPDAPADGDVSVW